MTKTWPTDLDAHDAYWKSLTEDSDAVAREARRAGINAMAGSETEPAPSAPGKLAPQPWYETAVGMVCGTIFIWGAILLAIFACMVKW